MLATATSRDHGWYVQPGRRAEFRDRLLAHGALREFVSEMRRPNGEIFWISENAHVVRDADGKVLYHEGTIEDITARVQAERSATAASELLRERTDALQITLDNAGRGIARIDANGVVVLYNRRFLELLDLPDALLAARPTMAEVIHFQEQRGDFGDHLELLNVEPMASVDRRALDAAGKFASGSYLRRTHGGLVIEVATQTLPRRRHGAHLFRGHGLFQRAKGAGRKNPHAADHAGQHDPGHCHHRWHGPCGHVQPAPPAAAEPARGADGQAAHHGRTGALPDRPGRLWRELPVCGCGRARLCGRGRQGGGHQGPRDLPAQDPRRQDAGGAHPAPA